MVHFLGFGWGNYEVSGGCGARYVGVLIDAFPQERGTGFGTLIPKVLMFKPSRVAPPPAVTVRTVAVLSHTRLLRIARDAAGCCQCRIKRFKARRQRIY